MKAEATKQQKEEKSKNIDNIEKRKSDAAEKAMEALNCIATMPIGDFETDDCENKDTEDYADDDLIDPSSFEIEEEEELSSQGKRRRQDDLTIDDHAVKKLRAEVNESVSELRTNVESLQEQYSKWDQILDMKLDQIELQIVHFREEINQK